MKWLHRPRDFARERYEGSNGRLSAIVRKNDDEDFVLVFCVATKGFRTAAFSSVEAAKLAVEMAVEADVNLL